MRKQRFERFAVNLLVLGVLATFVTVQGAAQAAGDNPASHKITPKGRGLNGQAIANGPNAALNPAPSLPPDKELPGSRPYSQFAPYYTVGDGFMTMLMLNNATQTDLSVKVTLYALDGQPAELPVIHVSAHETREVNLNEWVAGLGNRYVTGSLRLDYQSIAYALGAMVMMVNEAESIEIDVLARPAFEFKSNHLEAMWWMPEDAAEVQYAVENTTETRVHGKLTLTDGEGNPIKSVTLDMSPYETRLYKLREILGEDKRRSARVGGIFVEHLGKPGDLMAQCFVLRRSKGFSASFQFEDPKGAADSRLEGAGILLGNDDSVKHSELFSGRLLLRNTSSEPVVVKPLVQSGTLPSSLPEIRLKAGEAREILVPSSSVVKETGTAGMAIQYSGEPGSVLGYWFSIDRSGSLIVETPLRSPASVPQAGSNPWSLDGDYSSVLYVKNTGNVSGSFVAQIFYHGGQYMIGMKTVEGGETAAIDIRKLRDEQISDVYGHKLPVDLREGQINWRTRSGGPRLIGRVNAMSVSKGLANNMSCSTCCSCATSVSVSLVPGSWAGTVGSTFSLTPWETDTDGCGNTHSYPIGIGLLAWSSDTPSVASVDQSAVVSCRAAGTALVSGDGFFHDSLIDYSQIPPNGGCFFCTDDRTEQNPGTTVAIKPAISGPNTVWWFSGQSPSGYATSITLTSSAGASTSWSVTANANQISLSSTSGSSITVTATGSPVSGAVGEVQVTVTANGQTSSPFSLTTRRPFRLVAGAFTSQCDATFGYTDFLNYTIQDNLLTNMPLPVPLNENWTTGIVPDFTGTNWRRGPAGFFTTLAATPAAFSDEIQGENVALPPNPTPICIGAEQAVEHWGQEWRIGSTVTGSGTRVQADILQKFTQHAEHDVIFTGSGVQP